MGTKEEVMKALKHWATKIEDPDVKDRFEDFNKTVQFTMKDLNAHFKFIIENQKARVEEGKEDSPSMQVITTSDIIIGITNGEVDPMEAFMNGELEAKGNLPDLTKLEVLMEEDDED
ncbi:MAG TPA: SCP2 sterol-binding domain-containing protein [Candidatus Deferrimicrobium sp.]|nr:SCP2 sterol-binding domain-containing protein [Candidatus Deferrimicrobium sp.]